MTNTSDKTVAGKIDTSDEACERACKWINAGWGVATVLKANEGVEVTALIRALCAERDEACTGNEILKAKLSALCEAVVVNDSYGVEGSSFQTCLACGAGGAPGIVFEHTTDCAVGRSEEVSERWFKERSDELKEYEDEEKRLLARAEAAESELSSLRAKVEESNNEVVRWKKIAADWNKENDSLKELHRAKACGVSEERNARQAVVVEWGARCFGAEHMADKIVRAARFFEEASELVQAVGLPRDHAMRAFDHVYGRLPGDVAQEVGGVGVTLMALCNALGLSADDCETKEIARCLSKSPESFAARNKAKLEQVDAVLDERKVTEAPYQATFDAISHATRNDEAGRKCISVQNFQNALAVRGYHVTPITLLQSAPQDAKLAAPMEGEAAEALRPFAEIAALHKDWSSDKTVDRMATTIENNDGTLKLQLNLGHFRAAASALESLSRRTTTVPPEPSDAAVKALKKALEPFAKFADPTGAFSDSFKITAGSGMARRQLTMGHCYRAKEALAAYAVDRRAR